MMAESADVHAADECQALLDRGYGVVMYRNTLGSYTAMALTASEWERVERWFHDVPASHTADDLTPMGALDRLTEKCRG